MPATPAQIAFALLPGRSALWSDATVKTAHGNTARDTAKEPVETYFDDVADALEMAEERGGIIGKSARRFVSTISGIVEFDFATELEVARVIDDEKLADMNCAVVSAAQDLDSGQTEVMLWGTLD